jgi:hypothetical protein
MTASGCTHILTIHHHRAPYRDTDRSTASHASPCRNHVGEQSPSLETSFRHISNEQKVCNFEQTAVG